jgi:hypothetical protein
VLGHLTQISQEHYKDVFTTIWSWHETQLLGLEEFILLEIGPQHGRTPALSKASPLAVGLCEFTGRVAHAGVSGVYQHGYQSSRASAPELLPEDMLRF